MVNKNVYILFFFVIGILSYSQIFPSSKTYTREDTLKGSNTEFRKGWDVLYYNILCTPDFENKRIKGTVDILFKVIDDNIPPLQIDLDESLQLTNALIHQMDDRITENQINNVINSNDFGKAIYTNIKRKGDFIFINHSQSPDNKLEKGHFYLLSLQYSGKPVIAKNPPWDGGWIFTKDKNGNPWMSVACQGIGASVWYPCKDYLGDEPDWGATLQIIVPDGLTAIGNGKLIEYNSDYKEKGLVSYTWKVTNPINTYNIIPYIGKYVHFQDSIQGEKGQLDIDYWVLDYNLEKAQKHFQQVKPMLKNFEHWMGPYPFYEDGYKLVEAPYLGMEHQSNIAYGNHYVNGYLGNDLSSSGWGLKWDYIIIHESGHEWFGNNISVHDNADLWVHEGFTQYTEVLHTEGLFGKKAGDQYAQGLQRIIQNDIPIIGKYGVNKEGSSDMYAKGACIVHTLRQLIENDELFRNMLRDMNADFYHQTVSSQQIEDFISSYTGKDLTVFFNQYLRTIDIPVLEYTFKRNTLHYRYANVIDGFDMPIQLENNSWIYPTTKWKKMKWEEEKTLTLNPNFLVHTKEK